MRRKLITGSSTDPTVFESGRPSIIETVRRTWCPVRETGAIRFILQFTHGVASTTTTWAAHTIASSSDRLRRVAKQCAGLRHEFCLNKQIRKGRMGHIDGLWSQGQLGIEVTCKSRAALLPILVTEMRRTSASSSDDTRPRASCSIAIRRIISARSSEKDTS